MIVLPHDEPAADRGPLLRPVLWAWVAVALTPAGWALGVVFAFLSGENAAEGTGAAVLGALSLLCWTAAPTAAAILAVGAVRAGQRSARIAVAVSLLLLPTTLVLLPILSFGRGWIIDLVVIVSVLGLVELRRRGTATPP